MFMKEVASPRNDFASRGVGGEVVWVLEERKKSRRKREVVCEVSLCFFDQSLEAKYNFKFRESRSPDKRRPISCLI